MKNTVCTRQLESGKIIPDWSQSHRAGAESHFSRPVGKRKRFSHRSLHIDKTGTSIIIHKSEGCHTFSRSLLVRSVDAVLFTGICCGNHSTERNILQRQSLSPHKISGQAVIGFAISIRRNLGKIERQFLISPFLPQHRHKGRLHPAVEFIIRPVIASLVPDESLDSEWSKRMQHCIVQTGWHKSLLPFRPPSEFISLQIHFCCKFSFQQFPAHPGLNAAAAPGHVDDTDRDTENLIQSAGKEICIGTRLSHTLGSILCPSRGAFVPDLQGSFPFYITVAHRQLRICIQNIVCRAGNRLPRPSRHRHFHIGLTAAQPNLPYEDIADASLLPVVENNLIRTSG